MSYQQKDNEIVLFVNDRKAKESDPDSKGSGMVNGVEVWANAWRNVSKDGKKYLSIKTTPKEQQPAPKPQQRGSMADMDSDIPF